MHYLSNISVLKSNCSGEVLPIIYTYIKHMLEGFEKSI